MPKLKCEKCGTLNREDSEFCEECGNSLNNEKQEKSEEISNDNNVDENNEKFCPYCGSKIPSNVLKCRYCGEWIDKSKNQSISNKANSIFDEFNNEVSSIISDDLVSNNNETNNKDNSNDFKKYSKMKLGFLGGLLGIIAAIFYTVNPLTLLITIISSIFIFFGAEMIIKDKKMVGMLLTIIAGILSIWFLPVLGALMGIFGGRYGEKNSKKGEIILVIASLLSLISFFFYLIDGIIWINYAYSGGMNIFIVLILSFISFMLLLIPGSKSLKDRGIL